MTESLAVSFCAFEMLR